MEQSKVAKAQEHEQEKRKKLIESLPRLPKPNNTNNTIIYEDEDDVKIDVSSVIFCDDKIMEGCLRTMCTLVCKADDMVADARENYFPPLLLYAETNSRLPDADVFAVETVTSFIRFYGELADFCSKAFDLFHNVLHQMSFIRQLESNIFPVSKRLKFTRVWRSMGDLLAIFIQLDEILRSRKIIRKHLHINMRSILKAISENEIHKFSPPEVLEDGKEVLVELDRDILSGHLFRNIYERALGDLDESSDFANDMATAINDLFEKWDKCADDNLIDRKMLLSICSLTVYYYHHFANFCNKNIVKKIFTVHKKILVFNLLGDILFYPCEFLYREIGDTSILDKKIQAALKKQKDWISDEVNVEKLVCELIEQSLLIEPWADKVILNINERKSNKQVNLAKLYLDLADLFLQGIQKSESMNRLLKTLLSVFAAESNSTIKMTKRITYVLNDVIIAIKKISQVFNKYWRLFLEATKLASQQWRCHAVKYIENARNGLNDGSVERKVVVCTNSALAVARNAVLSTATNERLKILLLAIDFGNLEGYLSKSDIKQFNIIINRIENLRSCRKLAMRVTNCSFLLHFLPLVDLFWKHLFKRKPSIGDIERYCCAISDVAQMCTKAKHACPTQDKSIKDIFLMEVFTMIKTNVLSPLCCSIENDLRILTHPHLTIDERDRLTEVDSKFIKTLLKKDDLKIFDMLIDFKGFVSSYLEKTFYNLSVIASSDCQTYVKMADMAKQKYNLKLIAGDFLRGDIEQPCDIMEMTENLNSFVCNFNFSLYKQMFMEKQSHSRRLAVVSQDDFTKACKKYGLGLLPTCINSAYKLLVKKINMFYQFMNDVHVRAQAQLALRQYLDEKKYTMNDADKLAKNIARVGSSLMSQGKRAGTSVSSNDEEYRGTPLDKFRILITQIGNILSYTRSVNLASNRVSDTIGRNYSSDLQSLIDEIRMSTLDESDDVNDGDKEFEQFKSYFTEVLEYKKNDYSQLFLPVFHELFSRKADKLENSEEINDNRFLSVFFMLVPSLTLSHADHMLICRNRLKRSITMDTGKELTVFDDGFSIGISFMLSVLDIWPQFEDLDWFSTLGNELNEDYEETKKNVKTSQGAQLKIERLDSLKEEFNHMYYTINSSKLFFLMDDIHDIYKKVDDQGEVKENNQE